MMHEVWLIDTGYFIDITHLHPAWSQCKFWYSRMIKRRVLRLWVTEQEAERIRWKHKDRI